MKRKILNFLRTTQKATAAVAGGVSILASATFLPSPWNYYLGVAGLVLTWLLTYFFPYVEKTVSEFSEDFPASEPADDLGKPIEGTIIEPPTDEFAAIPPVPNTVGIPVIEGHVVNPIPEHRKPFTGALSVDEILARLRTEGPVPA